MVNLQRDFTDLREKGFQEAQISKLFGGSGEQKNFIDLENGNNLSECHPFIALPILESILLSF